MMAHFWMEQVHPSSAFHHSLNTGHEEDCDFRLRMSYLKCLLYYCTTVGNLYNEGVLFNCFQNVIFLCVPAYYSAGVGRRIFFVFCALMSQIPRELYMNTEVDELTCIQRIQIDYQRESKVYKEVTFLSVSSFLLQT
jgi:hypothetical protein